MIVMHRFLVAIVLANCLACAGVRPPTGAEKLNGYVLDQSGNPLAGVLVEARQHWWGPAWRTFTDADGSFLLTNLTPGRYRVEASARDQKLAVRDDVPVPAGKELQLISDINFSRTEAGASAITPARNPPPAAGPAGCGAGRSTR